MNAKQGPPLQQLTRRLSECPPDFLAEPRIGKRGQLYVDAVVADLVVALGGELPSPGELAELRPDRPHRRNDLRIALIGAWMLHDPWFRTQRSFAEPALEWLLDGLYQLGRLVDAERFVNDAERREELARRCLDALGLVPEGESEAQAKDRLTTLDSVEQQRVLQETQARQQRAEELRKKMEEQRAREAAARWNRE